jgi:hypothetical protein
VTDVLQCLKKYGQRLDLELAKEMGMPLATVRQRLAGLAATGAVIMCNLTRFENGTRIDAWQCRVSGYVPPLAPGRKAKPRSWPPSAAGNIPAPSPQADPPRGLPLACASQGTDLYCAVHESGNLPC